MKSEREFVLPDADRHPPTEGSVLFVGTATTLIRCGGFSILTDPNFLHAGDHAHLGYGLTTERLTEPALEIGQLPPLDLCLLSHLHGDHWDEVAEAALPRSLPVVTTPKAARELRRRGFSTAEGVATWESISFSRTGRRLRITAMPGRHGPTVVNRLLPPVMGSMLEWEKGGETVYRMYISGDTLLHADLEEIPRRYPDINLGLFHLGGTRILGILVTMDAAQGIEAVRIIHPRTAIPIHYNDYKVFRSPLEDFMEAVKKAGLQGKVSYLAHGDTYDFRTR
ncbi:MAG TPA: MBL fold metallo-hydrolase [Verrucomicrobiae bacterium]|nr:MBL fold metallo-hydrolase [Verrucomicrobiae bacterium]